MSIWAGFWPAPLIAFSRRNHTGGAEESNTAAEPVSRQRQSDTWTHTQQELLPDVSKQNSSPSERTWVNLRNWFHFQKTALCSALTAIIKISAPLFFSTSVSPVRKVGRLKADSLQNFNLEEPNRAASKILFQIFTDSDFERSILPSKFRVRPWNLVWTMNRV